LSNWEARRFPIRYWGSVDHQFRVSQRNDRDLRVTFLRIWDLHRTAVQQIETLRRRRGGREHSSWNAGLVFPLCWRIKDTLTSLSVGFSEKSRPNWRSSNVLRWLESNSMPVPDITRSKHKPLIIWLLAAIGPTDYLFHLSSTNLSTCIVKERCDWRKRKDLRIMKRQDES
jgi:hypothetical protein